MRFLLIVLAGCGGSLAQEDVTDLQNAAKTSAAAYHYQDAGTASAALIRATHCSVVAVLRDQKRDAPDSGIECQ